MLLIKRLIGIFVVLAVFMAACDKPVIEKPKKLIPRDKMIDIITDMHYAEALYQNRRYSSDQFSRFTEADFYYSILKKYNYADSVFEKSLIYYSSTPKEYEKIYSRVLNKLSEMEQAQLEEQQKPVDIGLQK